MSIESPAIELQYIIADEVKAFAEREGFMHTLWPWDSLYWRVSQDIRPEPNLLCRDVCVLAERREREEFLFFMPSLMRWKGEEKGWDSVHIAGEAAIKYPLRELYPRKGTKEETRRKLKILIEYAWLMVALFEENDIKAEDQSS